MNDIRRVFESQRRSPLPMDIRLSRLSKLGNDIIRRQDDIVKALAHDLGRPEDESKLVEILPLLDELHMIHRSLRKWVNPTRVPTPFTLWGCKSEIHHRPQGRVLIMSPWNYPFQLAMLPLVSAFAAGNTVMLRCSESVPHINAVIDSLLENVFSKDEVAMIKGDRETAQFLLSLPFNHFFFTGSPSIGKEVMKAAADHHANVTLELGGKSPCIIDETADIELAAERIAWGKWLNAGQTCVAPDYVCVHSSVHDRFVDALVRAYDRLHPDGHPRGLIVNDRRWVHLRDLVDRSPGRVLMSRGEWKREARRAPALVLGSIDFDSPIMREEIFGPFLPVLTYDSDETLFELMRPLGRPLALYLFSKNAKAIECRLQAIDCGGACVNEVILHLANPHLPFGGNGQSGMGQYHGHHGFLTFTHATSVLTRRWRGLMHWFYPPFTERTKVWMKRMVSSFSGRV